jgi:uncharacterized coiled-coil protein SlyX
MEEAQLQALSQNTQILQNRVNKLEEKYSTLLASTQTLSKVVEQQNEIIEGLHLLLKELPNKKSNINFGDTCGFLEVHNPSNQKRLVYIILHDI